MFLFGVDYIICVNNESLQTGNICFELTGQIHVASAKSFNISMYSVLIGKRVPLWPGYEG